jgi:hypothetical protein
MRSVRSVVHGATKHIEHAAIDMNASQATKLFVEVLRTFLFKIDNCSDTEIAKILCNTLPYSGNLLQLVFLLPRSVPHITF